MARQQRSGTTPNPNLRTSTLPLVKKGDPVLAKSYNDLLNAVNQLMRGNGLPSQVYAGPARGLIQMKIADISADDYLLCNHYDGAVQGTIDIAVAKPYLVRTLASWNSITYSYSDPQTRVATSGSDTEDQVLVPAYVVGDIIYVQVVNWTGVNDATPSEIKLLDVNADARAWAKVDA